MVNDQDFKKQFANMGIDKESIMNANKPFENGSNSSPDSVLTSSSPQPVKKEVQNDSQEIMILKRKLDYLQSNIMTKFEEKFAELDAKIDAKKVNTMGFNREITALKNDVEVLKQKVRSVRVVFDGEDVGGTPTNNSKPNTDTEPSQPAQQNNGQSQPKSGEGNPGAVKVEDYFNFSNKKFD